MTKTEKMHNKPMIVKVQLPLSTNEPEPLALVYNENRKYDVFMRITPDLIKVMEGRPKAFFHATYDKVANNTILGKEAPHQPW